MYKGNKELKEYKEKSPYSKDDGEMILVLRHIRDKGFIRDVTNHGSIDVEYECTSCGKRFHFPINKPHVSVYKVGG